MLRGLFGQPIRVYRVLGFRVSGIGFRGSGCRVLGLGFRGSGYRVQRFRV